MTEHRTIKDGPVYQTQAYIADDLTLELRVVKQSDRNHVDALGESASGAAENLAQGLEDRYGVRVSGPDPVPAFSAWRRVR